MAVWHSPSFEHYGHSAAWTQMDCSASHNHGPAGYDPICLGFQVGPDDRIGSSSLLQQHIGEHDLLALSPLKLIVQVSVTLALIDQ